MIPANSAKYVDVIDEAFEPCAPRGLAEFDPGDHAVHLVKEAGNKEKQCARDVVGVDPLA